MAGRRIRSKRLTWWTGWCAGTLLLLAAHIAGGAGVHACSRASLSSYHAHPCIARAHALLLQILGYQKLDSYLEMARLGNPEVRLPPRDMVQGACAVSQM